LWLERQNRRRIVSSDFLRSGARVVFGAVMGMLKTRRPRRLPLLTLLAAALMALAAAGCAGNESYQNIPKAPAVLTVSVIVAEDEIQMSPRQWGAGPVRFITVNQTGTRQIVSFDSERIERDVPVGAGQSANFKLTTEPGSFTISASNVAASELSFEVGPMRESAQNDMTQP
jgi:hypothetical protein